MVLLQVELLPPMEMGVVGVPLQMAHKAQAAVARERLVMAMAPKQVAKLVVME